MAKAVKTTEIKKFRLSSGAIIAILIFLAVFGLKFYKSISNISSAKEFWQFMLIGLVFMVIMIIVILIITKIKNRSKTPKQIRKEQEDMRDKFLEQGPFAFFDFRSMARMFFYMFGFILILLMTAAEASTLAKSIVVAVGICLILAGYFLFKKKK